MTAWDGAGHLGDLLSALADGELAAGEVEPVRRHLDGCPSCVTEFDAVRSARAMVRGLPPVDPPFGFLERSVARPGRLRVALAGSLAAAAAAVVVVSMASPGPEPVHPRVADLVERHAATASVAGDPVSQFVPAGVPVSFRP